MWASDGTLQASLRWGKHQPTERLPALALQQTSQAIPVGGAKVLLPFSTSRTPQGPGLGRHPGVPIHALGVSPVLKRPTCAHWRRSRDDRSVPRLLERTTRGEVPLEVRRSGILRERANGIRELTESLSLRKTLFHLLTIASAPFSRGNEAASSCRSNAFVEPSGACLQ